MVMRGVWVVAVTMCVWSGALTAVHAQGDSMSRSERKAEEKRVKATAKAEKKALKEFEKNYIGLEPLIQLAAVARRTT